MDLFSHPCPYCASTEIYPHTCYQTQAYGSRTIHNCPRCDIYFSESFDTPRAGLKTSRLSDHYDLQSEE